jgi:cytidylate kinase
MNSNQKHIIAIDGTAASGKGTLAKKLSSVLGFDYLDTGKLYRFVGLEILKQNKDPSDEKIAIETAKKIQTALKAEDLKNPALQEDNVGQAASKVAAIESVREALLEYQRNFSKNPPNSTKGAVLDGRDIGTIVCPDADLKFFIDAKIEIRAKRRTKELQFCDIPVTYEAVLADMRERDARDAGRDSAPMKAAADAILLDTSEMNIDEVLEKALFLIKEKLAL